jgi:hypothetical protein
VRKDGERTTWPLVVELLRLHNVAEIAHQRNDVIARLGGHGDLVAFDVALEEARRADKRRKVGLKLAGARRADKRRKVGLKLAGARVAANQIVDAHGAARRRKLDKGRGAPAWRRNRTTPHRHS